MLNKCFCFLVFGLLLSSCQQEPVVTLAPEYLYEVSGQKPICELIDDKKKTISLLYGNTTAHQAAGDTLVRRVPGASYTLVTWKQKQMPGWYGTDMNGEIYSVETLKIPGNENVSLEMYYRFKAAKAFPRQAALPDRESRIKLIIAERAAILP